MYQKPKIWLRLVVVSGSIVTHPIRVKHDMAGLITSPEYVMTVMIAITRARQLHSPNHEIYNS